MRETATRHSFNPRPPPERGATVPLCPCHIEQRGFNPRPPPERGATHKGRSYTIGKGVSIHAPLRREERRCVGVAATGDEQFQSTPPSGERSDCTLQAARSNPHGFNPRPPPERGATSDLSPASAKRSGFQSTPPSGERSDVQAVDVRPVAMRFQSTPPSGERSDTQQAAPSDSQPSFNPRPPPERGATCSSLVSPPVPPSFNPRPPPERGAT